MAPKILITKSKNLYWNGSHSKRLVYKDCCEILKFIFSFSFQNSDGTTQLLSGCLRDFRNKPFPTRARIEYYKNTLTVLFNNGMTQNPDEYELCMRSENVVLPPAGYFGVSAATGGLADDHDVYHFYMRWQFNFIVDSNRIECTHRSHKFGVCVRQPKRFHIFCNVKKKH